MKVHPDGSESDPNFSLSVSVLCVWAIPVTFHWKRLGMHFSGTRWQLWHHACEICLLCVWVCVCACSCLAFKLRTTFYCFKFLPYKVRTVWIYSWFFCAFPFHVYFECSALWSTLLCIKCFLNKVECVCRRLEAAGGSNICADDWLLAVSQQHPEWVTAAHLIGCVCVSWHLDPFLTFCPRVIYESSVWSLQGNAPSQWRIYVCMCEPDRWRLPTECICFLFSTASFIGPDSAHRLQTWLFYILTLYRL